MWDAEPNAGHRALADLERRAALHTLVTQNVDGLHQRGGLVTRHRVEIHGTVHEVKCLDCGWRGPMQETLDRVRAGEDDPPCLVCGGMLKSGTISSARASWKPISTRAQRAALGADVFLAIGTSLGVYPAAALPEFALSNGARLVIANAEPTPFDGAADAIVRERLGIALPAIVDAIPSVVGVVNFVGHIATGVAIDGSRADTEFLLGTALPDFAAMARLRLDRASTATAGSPESRSWRGMQLHHDTDAIFHRQGWFLDLEHDRARRPHRRGRPSRRRTRVRARGRRAPARR